MPTNGDNIPHAAAVDWALSNNYLSTHQPNPFSADLTLNYLPAALADMFFRLYIVSAVSKGKRFRNNAPIPAIFAGLCETVPRENDTAALLFDEVQPMRDKTALCGRRFLVKQESAFDLMLINERVFCR